MLLWPVNIEPKLIHLNILDGMVSPILLKGNLPLLIVKIQMFGNYLHAKNWFTWWYYFLRSYSYLHELYDHMLQIIKSSVKCDEEKRLITFSLQDQGQFPNLTFHSDSQFGTNPVLYISCLHAICANNKTITTIWSHM